MLHCPLDKFLLDCLRQGNPVNTHFLNQSESLIRSFCFSPTQHTLDFPRLNSYYRRIVHCLGRLYGLDHHVEPTNLFNSESTLRSMSLSKGDTWTLKFIPLIKCQEYIQISDECGLEIILNSITPELTTNESKPIESHETKPTAPNNTNPIKQVQSKPEPKIKILKRNNQSTTPVITSPAPLSTTPSSQPSIEEREATYQAARERIFKDFASNEAKPTKQLNPNAPVFKAQKEESSAREEAQTFAHIFRFSSQKPLEKEALESLAQQLKCFIKVYSVPASEGILLSNNSNNSLDEIIVEPFSVWDIQ